MLPGTEKGIFTLYVPFKCLSHTFQCNVKVFNWYVQTKEKQLCGSLCFIGSGRLQWEHSFH